MKKFEEKLWLVTSTVHGEERKYIDVAFDENCITTAGENVNELERISTQKVGCKYIVVLSYSTIALHLAVKLAGEKLYGKSDVGKGTLCNRRVFCSDMTFHATVEPIIYEGGIPVYIDTEYDVWNMCPVALKKTLNLETLAKYNTEGRLIWKLLHAQSQYRMNPSITHEGNGRAKTNACITGKGVDVGMDIFKRGLCLLSDIKMTAE